MTKSKYFRDFIVDCLTDIETFECNFGLSRNRK